MKNNIWNILKKELREMFRDKKSLSMMLIIPILIPLLVLGMSALFESQMNRPVEDYNRIGFAYDMSDVEEAIAKETGIEVITGSLDELAKQYEEGNLNLYVEKDGNRYIMHGADNEDTTYALTLADSYFSSYKEYLQQEYLVENDVDPDSVIQIITTEKQIEVEESFFASYVTNYAFLFIIMAITVSATYPATDTTAGEKERGTLETLLTFPIRSRDIIIGKFLSVSLSSIITGIISFLLAIISFLIAEKTFTIYEGVSLMPSVISLVFASVVIVAYSFLISGLCIAIASRSKTFKEAQSALTPLTFISFFPGMIAFMIEIKTNALLSLVPFLNYTLLFTDITNGSVNYFYIFLMLLSTFVVIATVLFIIIKQYKSEKVLFSN